MDTADTEKKNMPQWSNTTKIIITIILVLLVGFLIWRFQFILGPLFFAILLAYFIHPVANALHKTLHFPWRLASTLLYLLIFLTLFGLLAWGGISLVQPLQNLIAFLQKLVNDLPNSIPLLTSQVWLLGPFKIDLSNLNLPQLWTEFQGVVSPLLNKLGTLLGNIASGAASTITWTVFTILVSYFFSVESAGLRANFIKIKVPGYQEDIALIGKQLSRIWNSFLRGQLIVFLLTIVIYSILLTMLGVRYFFGLALLAGLARFVPYIGPFIAWTTYALVAIFQGSTIFNLLPLPYALIIVGCAMVIDFSLDNFVSPKVMASALNVHPAAVLVTVIIAANLMGFVGVILAAPILASFQLFLHYVTNKLMDQDPWKDYPIVNATEPMKISLDSVHELLKNIWNKIRILFSRKSTDVHINIAEKKEK